MAQVLSRQDMAGVCCGPPPPARPFARMSRRLPERKPPVTIAAGFACADGVVLCADTQLTSTFKQSGRKLWLHEGSNHCVAVTGAGDYVLLKLAKDTIQERLGNRRMSLDRVLHEVIEPVVRSIHEDHIDRAPDWKVMQGYDLCLIVAVRTVGSGLKLYESSRTGVSEISDFRCIGTGSPVASYIAGTMFSPALSVSWGQVLASYMIQQTKTFGLDCGGESSVVVIPHSGAPKDLDAGEIADMQGIGNEIHEAFGRVLFDFAETSVDTVSRGNSFQRLIDAVSSGRNQTAALDRVRRLIQAAPQSAKPSPESPTRGRKSRPPSQG